MSLIDDWNSRWFVMSIESEDKTRRKDALNHFNNKLFDSEGIYNRTELSKIWETVKKYMVKSLTDSAESCRILSVDLWIKFLNVLPITENNILHLIPILSRRLKSEELLEPSEEVRLKYVSLLRFVIAKYKEYLPAYSEDLVGILARTVTDNYPEIKRESCLCIEELASTIPTEFYCHSESFVKPILGNFTHQHWKVRVASVKAIGQVFHYGNSKSMDEVSTPLAQRLFDHSPAVRLAVVEVAGKWFVELRDRYSWWHKLIPLLVTGLHDEIEDIRIRAGELWDEAGKLYLMENEDDERLKDKMNFLTQNLPRYPHNSEKLKRPNLGCRVIVQQNLCKLLSGIGRELGDWLPDVRVRSAQLLCVLVLNAEQDITQYIEKLLPGMYRACNDEDPRVAVNIEMAASYMGYFVHPSIYCPLILPTLDGTLTKGHLQVFAAILGGSDFPSLLYELPKITSFLRQPHVCRNKKLNYQKQLIACCRSIVNVCDEEFFNDSSKITEDLLVILFTLLATCQDETSLDDVDRLLIRLPGVEEINRREYYLSKPQPILAPLIDSCESWTIYSDDLSIFRACLAHAPYTAAFNANLVLPILKRTMSDQADPEMRLKLFILLSKYFDSGDDTSDHLYRMEKLGDSILRYVVLPGLVWSAGRAAEAIRTAAVCCLCALIKDGPSSVENFSGDLRKNNEDKESNEEEEEEKFCELYSQRKLDIISKFEDFNELFDKLIPIVATLLDDNAKKTRLYSLRAICFLLKIGQKLSFVNEEIIHSTYPPIVKRLDDGCDDVRAAAVEALVNIWRALPINYDLVFSRNHVDYLYTTAIIHLHDPEPKFQSLMLDALLELAKIHPQLLATKIENCRSNFRNQTDLERLLNRCYNLLRQTE